METQSNFQALKGLGMNPIQINYDWNNPKVLFKASLDSNTTFHKRGDGSQYLEFTENGETIRVNLRNNTALKAQYDIVEVIAPKAFEFNNTVVPAGTKKIFAV